MAITIPFQISALHEDEFRSLFELSDSDLALRGGLRCVVDMNPGFPCRVSLEDAKVGEQVILVPYAHHRVPGPYQASGPIYVRAGARQAHLQMNEVPELVRRRLMSVRAYDRDGFLLASEVAEGSGIESPIQSFFRNGNVAYLHLHNAKPGCYSCRVDRTGR
jgi:Protein of unknown function (DUF1203)